MKEHTHWQYATNEDFYKLYRRLIALEELLGIRFSESTGTEYRGDAYIPEEYGFVKQANDANEAVNKLTRQNSKK